MMAKRVALGDMARDIRALFNDETREWVAKTGTEIKQIGSLVFVVMPHHVPAELPKLDPLAKAQTAARNMAMVLDILGDRKERPIDQIAGAMGASLSTARRALAPLLKTGAVHRKAAEGGSVMRWSYYRPG